MDKEKPEILGSWKEIAETLRVSVPTVKRYEKDFLMPVLRVKRRILIERSILIQWLRGFGKHE